MTRRLLKGAYQALDRVIGWKTVSLDNGRRLHCPILSQKCVAFHFQNDSPLYGILRQWLDEREGLIVDIGCNIGQTLINCLAHYGNISYLGVDPSPFNCAYVDLLIGKNHLSDCNVVCVAACADVGLARLRLRNGPGDPAASIKADFRPDSFYTRDMIVPTMPMDLVLKNFRYDRMRLIKIDVEGAELDVLKGLQSTIAEHSPLIMFELLPDRLLMLDERLSVDVIRKRHDNARRLDAMLRNYKYIINQFRKDGDLVEIAELSPANVTGLHDANFVAVPVLQVS